MFTLQIRRNGEAEYGTLFAGHRTFEEAAISRSRWRDNYAQFRDASFRILDPENRVVHK